MSKVNSGWVAVDGSNAIFTYLYSFGPGLAKALAVKGRKGFIVVSPPCRVPESAFSELEAKGPIAALVASNAFHHMGLPEWKKRFPNADVFAPAQSVARVSKKSGLSVLPLSDASAHTGDSVELIDIPHYKTGEVLVRMTRAEGPAWYVTDAIMNMPKAPPGPFGLIFKWTKSAPGLQTNAISRFLMMSDKHAVDRWMTDLLEKEPPTLLITTHGDDVTMSPPGSALREILRPA